MSEPGKPPDFSNLTENLSQQQAKITALKELVRQSESQHGRNTASAQEKVKNIAQRLSNLKSKAAKSKHHRSSSEISDYEISNIEEESPDTSLDTSASSSQSRAKSETPGSEKITLLRKQMELNRMKMAERETKSREIEQMVTQLKSKFETSQMSLEKSVELGRSMGDLSALSVSSLNQSKHRSVSDVHALPHHSFNLENERIKFLEKRVHELEEKDMPESDRVLQLERKILDLEENLREKESIIDARTRAVSLLSENLTKKKKDVVDSLEETKQEMFKMQETFLDAESSYKDEVERLNRTIQDLNEKCEILEKSRYDLTIENSDLKTKLEDVQDYSTKLSELNKLNEELQKQISNLESQKYEFVTKEDVDEESSDSLQELLKKREEEIEQLQENLQEKTIELNVVNANLSVLQEKYSALGPKSMFPEDTAVSEESQAEIAKLKQQLDDANKNMIKTKLKVKQLQKQVDSFNKSDSNQEIAKLTQRIAELEEDKSSNQWQEWGAETDSELEKKIKVLEATCQNQTTAIQLLEEQKIDISEDLQTAKRELETMKEPPVLDSRIEELEKQIHDLTEEKLAVEQKLARFANENMELHEKIDKLSKGSSAESIEMVNLTAQDNEEYQKALGGVQRELGDDLAPEISQELNESLRSLREESSELMSKIELFTIERREVLDKLDAVTIENQVLVSSIESIREEKVALEHENVLLRQNVEQVENLLSELQSDKQELAKKVSELSEHRTKLQEEINKLVKEGIEASPPSSPAKSSESPGEAGAASTIDRETCEKLLKQLDAEIQNLHKNKDKHQKLKISKKLSDNAKNVHATMTNLLVDYYKNLDECKQLRVDLERVKVLLSTVSVMEKDEDELKRLQEKIIETEEKLKARNADVEELQTKLDELSSAQHEASSLDTVIDDLKSQISHLTEESAKKDELIQKLQEMTDTISTERDRCEIEIQNQRSLVDELRKEFDQLCADVKVNNQKLNEKSTELDQLQREFDMKLKTSTNEVEILKTLVAEQKQLLIDAYQEHELDINQKIKEINDYQNQVQQMEDELKQLRQQNETNQQNRSSDLNAEVGKLKELLSDNERVLEDLKDELLHKQETIDTLNNQIIDLYKTMEENSNKIIEKEDELQYLQEINDTSREEIRNLHQKVSEAVKISDDLRRQLTDVKHENELLKQKSPAAESHSDDRVRKLEKEVHELEAKNKDQLDKLKKFAANLKKKQAQCTELEEKLAAGGGSATDSSEVNELKAQVVQYQEQMMKVENVQLQTSPAISNDELNELRQSINRYQQELDQKSQEIQSLQLSHKSVDQQLHESFIKCDQLEEALFDSQAQLQKLETEKMRLVESAKALDELSRDLEAVRMERDELTRKLAESGTSEGEKAEDKKKMDKLKAAVVQLKHKLADKKKENDELTEKLEQLKSSANSGEADSLKLQLQHHQQFSEQQLNEAKLAFDHEVNHLRQQLADLDATNRLLQEDKQRKVSLEGQLEVFEMTNIQLRERISNLEESIASFESERAALLREKFQLAAELEEKDELISRKLRETETDNFQMCENLKELSAERDSLLQRLAAAEIQLNASLTQSSQQISHLESDNSQRQQQIDQLQAEIKKMQAGHVEALAAKHAEIDEMEAELSSQLQKIESEKKSIQEALEKANDQIIDFQDEVVRLKDNAHSLEQARADAERELSWLKLQNENYTQDQLEIEQLRMQLMQSETEAENLRTQNENLLENHNVEITILRQQIADLEAMRSQVSQNQTDDQVMLENENVKLKELLAEKESQIQQKTIQLQMVSTFDTPVQAVNDPFASLMSAPPSASHATEEIKVLEQKLKEAEAEVLKLREASTVANMEMDMQSAKVQDLLHEVKTLNEKSREMQAMMDNLIRTNVELEASLERKNSEIDEIRNEMCNTTVDGAKNQELSVELVEKNITIQRLQGILERYEKPKQPAGPAGTASLFSDVPPTSSTSLFDDPFTPHEVVEEVIQPRSAYLCYDQQSTAETQTNDDWIAEQQENLNKIQQLHNHIQAMEQRFNELIESQTQGYRQRIHELEVSLQQHQQQFAVQQQQLGQQHQQILQQQQQLAQQQQQMAAAPPEPQPPAISQYFDSVPKSQLEALEIEDGWGWGASEGPEQLQVPAPSTSLLSPRGDLEVRLQEQRDIVENLEREKNALSEELSTLRENSKKMMKKLKEYQTKIKELETRSTRKSSVAESNDMDLVIQEELNSQIQKLEARIKEMTAEKEKELQEREALAKRVEVLTSASERMTEMKERQDSQMDLYQAKIRELNQKLHNLEEWGQNDNSPVKVAAEPRQAESSNPDQAKKIQELLDQIKDMQVDYDELQALLEEEKNNNKILESRLATLTSSNQEESSEIERLNQLLQDSSKQQGSLKEQVAQKDSEIRDLISKIDQLCNESSNIKTILDDLSTQIKVKTNENQELNDRLQKLASSNEELSRERQVLGESMEQNYRHHANDLEQQIQSLQAELQYKNSQIQELNHKVSELSMESDQTQSLIDAVSAKDQEMMVLRNRLSELEQVKDQHQQQQPSHPDSNKIHELEKINAELVQEKTQMEHELQVLNDQVLASLEFEDRMKNTILELDTKNIEIQMLKSSLEKFQQMSLPSEKVEESSAEIEKLQHEKEELQRNIDLLNAQWSQAVEQRGNEIASSWKQHLEMREHEFAELEESLRKQLEEKAQPTEATGTPVPTSSEVHDETLLKMQSMLENQEMEIVSLKEQLAIRSAEFAALSAKVDPYHQMSISPVPQAESDRVPRSELDLALYMLHQRDMRLEEMTMELVRLLEERDQLQIRLSNSIRQVEEVRRKFGGESSDVSKTNTPEKSAPVDTTADDDQLKAKLSELNTVSHSRDKSFQDDRVKRFRENITLLQRDTEHLPAEAVARIAGSSDQGQPPSSVFMNWIMGKSNESS